MPPKIRLLHERLAAVVTSLRHGEMVFIADAGSGTSAKSLVPLADDVEVIDIAVAPGLPSVADVLTVLYEAGDFETAIVTEEMRAANPGGRVEVERIFGENNVRQIPYLPDMYELRDRCKVFVQTGDYTVHANVIIVAGFPSPKIPMEWLISSRWFNSLRASGSGDGGPERD